MDFQKMKKALINAAEANGIKEYEIYYQSAEEISSEALKDEINSFSSSASGGISFRCIVNGKMGYASGELMTEQAMEDLVKRAAANAECIDSEDEVFIYTGSDKYIDFEKDVSSLMEPETIRNITLELQKKTYEASDKVSDGTQSGVISYISEIALYNSSGLDLSNKVGVSGGYVGAICRDENEAQMNGEYASGRSFEDFKDLPEKAVKKAIEKLGAQPIESGKYSVVFSGRVFADYLATFSPSFSAKNAQLGLSRIAGKEDTRIASELVTITDDPMRDGCPMKTNFDGEGVATSKHTIVENGILKTMLYDLTTAKKSGIRSTGNGQRSNYSSQIAIAPYSFGISAGTKTRDELFAEIGNGIFIDECKGFHAGANPITGDFSIESAGFRIKDGKLAEPIKSFTIAGNFFELLMNIGDLGNETKWEDIPSSFTIFGSPDILINDASIAGK